MAKAIDMHTKEEVKVQPDITVTEILKKAKAQNFEDIVLIGYSGDSLSCITTLESTDLFMTIERIKFQLMQE